MMFWLVVLAIALASLIGLAIGITLYGLPHPRRFGFIVEDE